MEMDGLDNPSASMAMEKEGKLYEKHKSPHLTFPGTSTAATCLLITLVVKSFHWYIPFFYFYRSF